MIYKSDKKINALRKQVALLRLNPVAIDYIDSLENRIKRQKDELGGAYGQINLLQRKLDRRSQNGC